ncbi:LacI family DNA-binding transcriptional regulator [Cellulomonas sp. P4]|uniref:LacI family DNA-binding transcriptional regulator n=1 Tax=Cellulomonas sp. P4 TaxID=3142533 RepID=UPI0031BB8164
MAGQVTLSDVAREAGVSLATASRALNGSANRTVGADLRERVLEAASRLRYSPDGIAQAMARGRTTALGLVVPDIADPACAELASGVVAAAEDAGLSVTLTSTRHEPGREAALVALLERQRARAVVLAGGRQADPAGEQAVRAAVDSFRAVGGAVASVGRATFGVPTVVVGDREGASDLVTALHGRGYRRFAVLAGPQTHTLAADRSAGAVAALAALGCPPPVVVRGAFSRDGGYEGMRQVVEDRADVQVVLAVSDVMAAGALAAARDAGLSVPGDLAVAGYGDVGLLRDAMPGLTTVRLPLADIGALAVRLALEPPAAGEPETVRVTGQVVLRGSTPGV